MERSDFRPLNEVIKDFIGKNNLAPRLREARIAELWPEIVGRPVARATIDIQFRNRKMFVRFSSSVVRAEVMMIREALVARINDLAGASIIDEVVVR